MDEKSQNNQIDNDNLRNFEQGFRRYFDENFPSIIPRGRGNVFPSRLLGGVKRIHKSKRGRRRRLPSRIKHRLTVAMAQRLSGRMVAKQMAMLEAHHKAQLDPHIPSQIAMSLIYE